MALQRYGVGDCEGGPRYDLEPMNDGSYVKFIDIEDMAKQLQTAIAALRSISNHRSERVRGNPDLRFEMHTTAQNALREMKLLT
jgi:hypothetical protein